jgi:uncharacterized integral membrane protein
MADRGQPQPQGKETNWRAWGLGVLIVLALIFIAQNSQSVQVKFLFFDASMPLIFGLLIATLLGVLIGYIGPIVRRHRRGDQADSRER